MLVLDRKAQEGLWIGERIYVKVLAIRRERVKLGIAAPSDVGIAREELPLRSGAEPRAETDRRDQDREHAADPRPVEETPHRSEAQYRALLTAIPDMMFRLSKEGRFVDFVPAKGQEPAVPVGEFLGRTVYEVLPADLARRTMGHVERALQTGDTEVFEYQIPVPLPNGDLRDFEARIAVSGNHEVLTIARDITERKRAEEALRDSEARLRTLVTNAPVILFAIDGEGVFTVAEGRGMTPVGLRPEEHVGRSVFDLYSNTPGVIDAARRALAGEAFSETVETENRVFEAHITPLRDGDGAITGAIAVAAEVTERERAEEALREREQRLRTVVENAPVGLFAIDREGVITLSEGKAQNAMGLKAGEHVGLSMYDVYRDFPGIVEGTRRVLAGEAMTATIRVGRVVLEVRTTPFQDDDGKITGAIGVATDVTDRKRAEDALRASEEMWRSLVQNSPDIIMNVGPDGTILLMNRTLPGFPPPEQVVGTSVYEFIPPEDHDTMRRALERAFRTGEPDSIQTAGGGPDRTTSYYETRLAPVKHDGEVASVNLVATDVTELRRAEEVLQRAREELEARVERQMEGGRAYDLTFRELTVLHLVAAGKADKEIAFELGISPRTASKHLENILHKMGSGSRTEAGVRAVREGLLGQPD